MNREDVATVSTATIAPRRVRIGGDLYHPQIPAGAKRVDRVTRWGNPHKVTEDLPAEVAVARYRADLVAGNLRVSVADVVAGLHGHDLACWCALDAPCHAEVLLRIANADRTTGEARDGS